MFSEVYVMKDGYSKLLFCCYFIDQFRYILQENMLVRAEYLSVFM